MLKDKIQQDLNSALKSNDEIGRSTLRMLLASVSNREKEKRYKIIKGEPEISEEELIKKAKLTDEEIVEVVSSEIKKRKEAIVEFERGKREDLVKKEKAEIEVLERYLPEQLSEEELKSLAKETIDEVKAENIKDMGRVMAELMPKVKGKADGSQISRIVKELLTPGE